uniref:G_PROTEIN_RECEP_F1_2 domain-containing protein n=1 Tax=Panagrellus redivivus TaxID=6233 RepID=A0A7E4VUW3_PANRE
MVELANVPFGHDLPAIRLIGFIIELILCSLLTILTVAVGCQLWKQTGYHLNLRITVFNMYISNPIMAFSRCIWIIHIIMAETLLSPWMVEQSIRLQTLAISAFWIMQIPAIFERICATIFYKSYSNWKCKETLLIIFLSWVLLVNISYDLMPMPIEIGYAIIIVANIVITPLYIVLFRINFNRYKNKSKNLTERYQLFKNVESMYPLAWTVAIEVVHNLDTLIAAVIYAVIVVPSENNNYQVVQNSVGNLIREVILIAYCLPFLVYSKERHKTKFINRVAAQSQNVNALYSKQFRNLW